MNDEELLEKYVATFPRLDEMVVDTVSAPTAVALVVGEPDTCDFKQWEPAKVNTPPSELDEIYAKLPGHFPKLFERMVLSYRWAEVELGTYRLLANPPARS